ncbi:MAG TPA: ABC transporter permease [Chloroflexota bacterium]|jgi:ABC-type transport system involved in multi-copper enzyme maturation permease subunit|nr:ABC transporter permease [Chloroflexota bacterium]
MSALLSAEWLKMQHRWMPRILILILMGINGLLLFGITRSRHDIQGFMPRSIGASLIFTGFLAQFIWPILAGAWAGNEYSWGTIRMILTRRPSRVEQALSGLTMMLIFSAITLIVAMIVGLLAGLAAGAVVGHPMYTNGLGSDFVLVIIKTFVAALATVMFYSLFAFAAGAIFQSPAAGIGVGIGASIATSIVSAIFHGLGNPWGGIADHFPYGYAFSLPAQVAQPLFGKSGLGGSSGPTNIQGDILGMLVYTVVVMGLLLYVVANRDVTA